MRVAASGAISMGARISSAAAGQVAAVVVMTAPVVAQANTMIRQFRAVSRRSLIRLSSGLAEL